MSQKSLSLVTLASANLPPDLWRAIAYEATQRDLVTARRTLLLTLLWQENYQVQSILITRVRYQLGLDCFGANSALTFRRDMQAVKAILAAGGFEFRYSRRADRPGYYIPGRPDLAPEVQQAIRGAAEEVDPRQIEIWHRLTVGQRVQMATRLSDSVRSIAVQRLQQQQPGLDRLAAQRQVLRRYYRNDV